MIFRRISYRIALQFTGFVFVLLLINGAIFLAADIGNARRQTHDRLTRTARILMENNLDPAEFIRRLPPPVRQRVRLVDESGASLFEGGVFEGVKPPQNEGFSGLSVDDAEWTVLTLRILRNGEHRGYLQLADIERLQYGELPFRAFIYLFVSIVISGLTFAVGLFFARRSLKPAEEMMLRLEQFTQDASHELRTPIAALSSSLDLALKNGKYKEGLLSAKDDLKEVSTLVERLLELARLDRFTLETETIDLTGLTEAVAEKHRSFAKDKSIVIETHLAKDVEIPGDALLLKQAIGNLIGNAIKFNKPKGTVIVRLTNKTLSVEDTGIGIAANDLSHVFDRFFQVEDSRSSGGLGLGLALVKRIVELHGWSIAVKSKERKGTTFTVTFA